MLMCQVLYQLSQQLSRLLAILILVGQFLPGFCCSYEQYAFRCVYVYL